MVQAASSDEGATDDRLLTALEGGPRPTESLAERCQAGRGRVRARLQALEDRGLVVRRGGRTSARWTLTEAGRERLSGGPLLVADGGDPDEAGAPDEGGDDDRFDPEVEAIPVEIGEGEWGGAEDFDLGKWKLVGGALVAVLGIVLVLVILRKLRG